MKNLLILPLFFLFTICLHSQLDANSVFTLPAATVAQITAITDAQEGALAYATDTQNVYRFNGSSWSEISASNTPNVYFGAFIISSTGNQTINGLPFQPSQISFVAHANVESYNLNSDNGVGNNNRFLPNSFGTANGFARDDSGSVVQQSIYVGGSGNSINDISRYASSSHCVGIRYGNQNGDSLGLTTASVTSFNSDGFTINVDNHSDDLVVLYQAYD